MAKDWCILRCSSNSTLPLARSLARAGIEAWTPIEQQVRRVPRASVKRTIQVALIPGYLFARTSDMGEVLAIMNSPSKDHRDFRLFKHNGGVPVIPDSQLAPLRLLERKSKAKAEAPRMKAGDTVRLTDGGFAGMTGTIESMGSNFAMVQIGAFKMPIKVAAYYLLPNNEDSAMAA